MERPLGVIITTVFVLALGTLPPALGVRLAMADEPQSSTVSSEKKAEVRRFKRPVHTPCERGEACSERKKDREAERREKPAHASRCANPRAVRGCGECGAAEACAQGPSGASCCPRE